MSTGEQKFGYAFGTFATIMVLILDFLVILSSVSNCIVYNKIASGEPNSDISVGWARFLLGVNITVAIFAFIIFFWIWYILLTGKKSIGAELSRKRELGGIGSYIYETSKDVINRFENNSQKVGALIRGSPQAAADAFKGLRNSGMSASDASSTVTAAASGNTQAAATVAAAVPAVAAAAAATTASGFSTLKSWVESNNEGSWDDIISSKLGDCSNPLIEGCSRNLKCGNGSLQPPCSPPISANDAVINELYAYYQAENR
jgi:hypothetical protein